MPVEIGPRASTLLGFLVSTPMTVQELYGVAVGFAESPEDGSDLLSDFQEAVEQIADRGVAGVRRQLERLERLGLVTRANLDAAGSDLWWRCR